LLRGKRFLRRGSTGGAKRGGDLCPLTSPRTGWSAAASLPYGIAWLAQKPRRNPRGGGEGLPP
jgi:hypothetical protein